MGIFEDALKRAAAFVHKQKGLWDEAAWVAFVTEIRKKGVDLSKETEDYLGSVLESMKRFYGDSGGARASNGLAKTLTRISEQTAEFVHESKGKWDHAAWERFVHQLQQAGVKLSTETTACVGDILEASKRFYRSLPLGEEAASDKGRPAAAKAAATAAAPAARQAAKSTTGPASSAAQGGLKKSPTKQTKKVAAKSTPTTKVAAKKANGKAATYEPVKSKANSTHAKAKRKR